MAYSLAAILLLPLLAAVFLIDSHQPFANAFSLHTAAASSRRSRRCLPNNHNPQVRSAATAQRRRADRCLLLLRLAATPHDDEGNNNNNNNTPPEESLILSGEAMAAQMAQLQSKYPTTESAYLAAARARNAAKTASREETATDRDWQMMQQQKQQAVGDIDDWEESAKEAGNIDSQILLPSLPEDGDDEPKLLLF
jgi:hypothetical protein